MSNEDIEQWVPVIGYENTYQVSDFGRIKNVKTNKFLKPVLHSKGYHKICLCSDGKRSKKYVHRVVISSFKGIHSYKIQVDHIDGNKINNKLVNLRWVTASENLKAAYRLGLKTAPSCTKENHGRAKLNQALVEEIKLLRSKGRTIKSIADSYNVSNGAVKGVIYGVTWKA